jgi:hypothetical protein
VWVKSKEIKNYTKREILLILSSVYDPLGFLTPKLIMQSLWDNAQKIDWDSRIPETTKVKWDEFYEQLDMLNEISLPRYLYTFTCTNGKPRFLELHGFSDSSEEAYGAVVYVRYVTVNGVFCELLTSKTRVAPLKKQTLPRLKLCAALVLAQLVCKIEESLKDMIKFSIKRLWTDSEIVLHWIRSPAQRWQIFVGNRVQKIQDLNNNFIWDYVQSKSNPADILSRGLQPIELKNCKMWWHGPEWLTAGTEPFESNVKFDKNLQSAPDVRNSVRSYVGTLTHSKSSFLFEKYSHFMKLVRMSAWLIRFSWNTHWCGPKLSGPLQHLEIQNSIYTLVKLVQREHFSSEIQILKNNGTLPNNSVLSTLSPFLDNLGVIRVGGRLHHSDLSWEARHQLVLPHGHTFTKLLIEYEHHMHLHAGPKLLGSVYDANIGYYVKI